MKNWIWKSFVQDGCRACSQHIKNTLAWKSLNSAWRVLTKIKLILCIDLLLWMRLGFTITHQNPNSSQNSGQKPDVQGQRRQGRFHQQERSWHRSFGRLKAFCLLIILKRVKKNNWGILLQSFNQTRQKNSWEKTRFAKEKIHLSSGQCTCPQKCFDNGKIKGSALWIVETSTLFPRFGSLWLLCLPKIQILPHWSAFFFKSRGACSCRGVFWRSYKKPLQGQDTGTGASLK